MAILLSHACDHVSISKTASIHDVVVHVNTAMPLATRIHDQSRLQHTRFGFPRICLKKIANLQSNYDLICIFVVFISRDVLKIFSKYIRKIYIYITTCFRGPVLHRRSAVLRQRYSK